MTIGLTPPSACVGESVRLFSHKSGICEWHLDGGEVASQDATGSIWVRWYFPGTKHIVLVHVGPLNGQRTVDTRTIVVV